MSDGGGGGGCEHATVGSAESGAGVTGDVNGRKEMAGAGDVGDDEGLAMAMVEDDERGSDGAEDWKTEKNLSLGNIVFGERRRSRPTEFLPTPLVTKRISEA